MVSLVGDTEVAILRVLGLGDAVVSQGMDWFHLPFPDTTAPNYKCMEQFMLFRSELTESIRKGEKIVIHCKGSLSRAGTVTTILLHQLGLEMSDAIFMGEKSGVLIALTQHRRNFYFHWSDFKSVIYVNGVGIIALGRTIFCLK